ncbi:MAG: hypothetical protein JWM21_902 [Acidobacteria bacterium]|nr:hypothetical protein [Acidobacteriota bacterium]
MREQKGLRLVDVVNNPDLHRLVLGDYTGAYSLGVTTIRGGAEYALVLEVEMEKPTGFPDEVLYEGEHIPVIVRGSFRIPIAHRLSID